jgi:hypothetical protein
VHNFEEVVEMPHPYSYHLKGQRMSAFSIFCGAEGWSAWEALCHIWESLTLKSRSTAPAAALLFWTDLSTVLPIFDDILAQFGYTFLHHAISCTTFIKVLLSTDRISYFSDPLIPKFVSLLSSNGCALSVSSFCPFSCALIKVSSLRTSAQ